MDRSTTKIVRKQWWAPYLNHESLTEGFKDPLPPLTQATAAMSRVQIKRMLPQNRFLPSLYGRFLLSFFWLMVDSSKNEATLWWIVLVWICQVINHFRPFLVYWGRKFNFGIMGSNHFRRRTFILKYHTCVTINRGLHMDLAEWCQERVFKNITWYT